MSRWIRTLLPALVAVLVLSGPAFRSDAQAADVDPTHLATYNALTRLALTAIGQQQGECFPWMRRVVQAATGIVIGTDYRLGYLQAGAVEVPPAAAQNGDIIQIANDANTVPTADYPGLHTTFILENQGGGKYKVVDSNSNYDGIVRVRDGYDPAASAARYPGLTFHVYRLPVHAAGAPAVTPPAAIVNTPGIIPIGSAAEIAADGDCLRVRSIAGLSGAIVGCLPTGARVTVTQPGPNVDGYHWVTISTGAITGWASEQYLRAVSGTGPAGPAPAATPQAAPPTPVATPTPVPTLGRILSGIIPARGMGLIVFGGGTEAQLLAASGCPSDTASFWASTNGEFVQLIPGVSIPIVNAAWRSAFPSGIPTTMALMASCRADTGASSAPAPSVSSNIASTPAPAAPAPAAIPAAAPPPAASAAASSYTVVEGDSLSSIAERFHGGSVSIGAYLDALYRGNGLTEDSLLSLGQVLHLPK